MTMTHKGKGSEPPRRLALPTDPMRFSRQCRGKVAHRKRKQALTAMNMHRASHPEDTRALQVYRCGECGHWHVGHSTPRRAA